MANILYIHYLSKFIEFLDTAIMIGKQNWRQLSFLHVFHHATTGFPVWWLIMRHCPGGAPYFVCFGNSLVHVTMYLHYLLRGLSLPSPIKPFVTLLQILQFVTYLGQAVTMLMCYETHRVPRIGALELLFLSALYFTLFTQFFVEENCSKKKKEKSAEDKKAALAPQEEKPVVSKAEEVEQSAGRRRSDSSSSRGIRRRRR